MESYSKTRGATAMQLFGKNVGHQEKNEPLAAGDIEMMISESLS